MIQQARQLSSHDGARAVAVALAAAGLVALAGVAGYEVGTMAAPARATPTQPVTQTQDAPPITGLQP